MFDVFIDVFPMICEGGSMYFVVLAEHRELAITAPADVEIDPELSIFRILGDSTDLISGRFWNSLKVVDAITWSLPISLVDEFRMLNVGCPSSCPPGSPRASSASGKLGLKMPRIGPTLSISLVFD